MADINENVNALDKKYLDYEGLGHYTEKVKEHVAEAVKEEADRAKEEEAKKVDKTVNGTHGTATIFNEASGGGAQFIHDDDTLSFVGVNDGGEDGLVAQIYADKKVNGRWVGSRINVYRKGVFYQSKASMDAAIAAGTEPKRDDPNLEIAVQGDLTAIENASKVTMTSDATAMTYTFTQGAGTDEAREIGSIVIPKDQFLKEAKFFQSRAEAEAAGKTVPTGTKFPSLYFSFETESGTSETWVDVSSLVKAYIAGDGINITLDDGKNVVSVDDTIARVTDVEAEAAARIAADNTKVDTTKEGTYGIGDIFNESDGGGAMFTRNSRSPVGAGKSFVGVHDGSGNPTGVQAYNLDSENSGVIIDVLTDKAYYFKGAASTAMSERHAEKNEIATIGDIESMTVGTITEDEIDGLFE